MMLSAARLTAHLSSFLSPFRCCAYAALFILLMLLYAYADYFDDIAARCRFCHAFALRAFHCYAPLRRFRFIL